MIFYILKNLEKQAKKCTFANLNDNLKKLAKNEKNCFNSNALACAL
jgi:hypothetical protein